MTLNIIPKLVKLKPKKRAQLLFETQKRNIDYLKKQNLELANTIAQLGTSHYEINITQDFFDIIDQKNGQYCHPSGKLLEYVTTLGAWHHTGWIDRLAVLPSYYGNVQHSILTQSFVRKMYEALPHVQNAISTGTVTLPYISGDKKSRFSGATLFLGVFTGLHIAHYLTQTETNNVALIEPDLELFSLSCFFLDYSAIEKKCGKLVLHVGPDTPESALSQLVDKARVTAATWLRILPGYPSKQFDEIISRFTLKWRALTEIVVPFDREVRNLCYGMNNLKNNLPVLYKAPELSPNSRIAIVASGPSLDKDVHWLKLNQDKLIIFAAHSSIRTLNKHGVVPDFQFNLDTEIKDGTWDLLELNKDIPFVCYYKASPKVIDGFKTVLLITEAYKANPVLFKIATTFTHPTTGNLMMSAAAHCKPSQLFLVGLDLGFKDINQDHVSGYWGDATHKDRYDALLCLANFQESQGKVFTRSYYNNARFSIEGALSTFKNTETKIFNLADGAKILGAQCIRSEDVDLLNYPEKQSDIEAFKAAFIEGDENWIPFKISGHEILKTMVNVLENVMSLECFEWKTFTSKLDKVWDEMVKECHANERHDLRIEAYGKLIQDLLVEWYRIMLFCKKISEQETAYKVGLEELNNTLNALEWPEELEL